MRLGIFMAASMVALHACPGMAAVLYRISGITDINLPAWSIGDPAVNASMDMCAYTTLLGYYSVMVSSAGGYVLTSGANQIPYTLRWDDSGAGALGTGGTALTNNVKLNNRQNPNYSLLSNDCSLGAPSGPTARLLLNITQAAMTAAPAGVYTGTISITLSPL